MTATIRHTVFIVDDVPQNVQVAATALRDEGYTVAFATSGPEALERIPLVQPDVVLLDVMMPEMNGFQVCQQLKRNSQVAAIPVIFLTALNDGDAIVKGFAAGGVDYVTKPFNTAELLARVRTHCTLYTMQRLLAEKTAILEDLTQSLEAQVAQRTEALHAALRRQQNFGQMSAALVALINHEFRTPMTVIQSSVEMMRYAHRLDAERQEELCCQIQQRIGESLSIMQKHLDSIALMIQLHTALLHEKPQRVAPARLVQEVAMQCAAEYNRQQSLQVVIEHVPDQAILLPENLRVALKNIISNAFAYSPPGTSVVVTCTATDGSLSITVDDDGPGIDSEEEQHLYQWFKRGRSHTTVGAQRGLGLGLPLAKLAAETMMGMLWHERRFPRGTRFVLDVPYGHEVTTAGDESARPLHLSNGQQVAVQ
ncbi:MAG: hybrid sensor histidine kinase/response regulator [Candidatus Kapaibacterium sp.]|nr:MAG: hybrid sensor histidine kinase/response regulator [Candidatus Kapabacteria bacterium]